MPVVSDYTALISGSSISGTTGRSAFVSYSFPTAAPDYLSGFSAAAIASIQPYSDAAKAVVRQVMQLIGDASGLTFFEVEPGNGDIKFFAINISLTNNPTSAGFAYYPDNAGLTSNSIFSDVFIGNQYTTDLHINLHETLHALGLKHPFEGDNTLATDLDNYANTVMSYTPGGTAGIVLGRLDIDALHHIYGTPSTDGTHVSSWNWNATTLTLTQNGGSGDEHIRGIGGTDIINGGAGVDTILGREGHDQLNGEAGDDTIYGDDGNDILAGGEGIDTLSGGTGNDRLDGGIAGDRLNGDNGDDVIVGGDGTDSAFGGAGADRLEGGAGADSLNGGPGDDTLEGGSENDSLIAGGGNDRLSGGDGDDNLTVSIGPNDSFVVDGGPGNDVLSINAASDGVFRTIDVAQIISGGAAINVERFQLFASTVGSRLIGGASDEFIQGSAGDDILIGNGGADTFSLGGGNDVVLGGDGNDFIQVVSTVTNGSGQVYGEAGADQFSTWAGTYVQSGGSGNDRFDARGTLGVISGDDGDDVINYLATSTRIAALHGGAGFDQLNLTLSSASGLNIVTPADWVVEGILGRGLNTISITSEVLSTTFNLTDGNVTRATGGAGADIFNLTTSSATSQGGAGDDVFNAGTGVTLLVGGLDADRFVFGSSFHSRSGRSDFITAFESSIDKVDLTAFRIWDVTITNTGSSFLITGFTAGTRFELRSSGTFVLADILQTAGTSAPIGGTAAADSLNGTANDDYLFGDTGDDAISAGAGNDALNGGAGNDRLTGGIGDDGYYVNSQGDIVYENPGEGEDTVTAAGDFYLYANVENLVVGDASATLNAFGVGNALANTIWGNNGQNLLIGMAGDDTLWGGGAGDQLFGADGDDTLYGEAGIDYLAGGAGADEINGGTEADNLFGEEGNDWIEAGSDFVTDILNGGAGDDVLRAASGEGDYDLIDGGSGNDTYYVDTPADLTFEAAGGGIDLVYADIQGGGYYLYAHTENLILLGETPFGVGNELNNQLTGNAIGNYLLGGAGDDVLNGRGGNDVLFGEAGADTFIFHRGTGGDVVGDLQIGTDKIDLRAFGINSFSALQAMFVQDGAVGAILLGGGDLVVLHNVTMTALTANDFIIG